MKKQGIVLLFVVIGIMYTMSVALAGTWGFYTPEKGSYFARLDITNKRLYNSKFSFYVNLIKFDNLHAFELSDSPAERDALFEKYANVVGTGINTKMLSIEATKEVNGKLTFSGKLGFADANISNGTSFMFGFGMSYHYKPNTTFRFSFEQVDKNKHIGIKVYIDF